MLPLRRYERILTENRRFQNQIQFIALITRRLKIKSFVRTGSVWQNFR